MSKVSFSGNRLKINCIDLVLQSNILNAFIVSGVVVVLFDPDEIPNKKGQFKNLVAFDALGKKLWEADLPTDKSSDVYWKMLNKDILIAYSFSSYICEIDVFTGKILSADFYK